MTDILEAAKAHLASLPPHLKDRYSATIISKLIDEVLLLEELRKLDGESLGKSLEEYNKMKELCVNGKYLTEKERKAVTFAAEHFGAFKNQAATLRSLLERLGNDSPQLETDGEGSRG
jgi:hypothetical protein